MRSRPIEIGGWVVMIAGTVLRTIALYVDGGAPFVDWHGFLPAWVAGWLPNWESELGLALAVVGSVPVYWRQFTRR